MNFTQKLLQLLQDAKMSNFTVKQACTLLGSQNSADRQIVKDALATLQDQAEVYYDENDRRYNLVDGKNFGKATFQGNKRGFGFLLREDGDLFVPAPKTYGAYHGDTVLYQRLKGTDDEAKVLAILQRGKNTLVGTLQKEGNVGFGILDDQHFSTDVFIPPKRMLGAKNGQKVVVKIHSYPKDNRNCPEGEIVQVLGYPNQNNVQLLSVAVAYGVQTDIPENVQKRAEKIPQTLCDKDYIGRRDLRNQTIFTIDGDDAKDLDDAVSITFNDDGTYTLGVHIADVSHYVKPGDEIDKEAFNRATSVYFPNMVFPMLPRELSNGICSLYQGVDRLTLTCQMTINPKGNVVDYEVYPSVINSCRRLTYTQVQALFDGDENVKVDLADVADSLFKMQSLAQILQIKRLKRGNIEFATKEVTFVCDDNGDVVDVAPYQRKFSHQLIEEFMIIANETVAEYIENCSYPFVYRTHEKPDEQKLAVLMDLMSGVGIKVKHSQQIHNSVLQDALLQAKQTPYFALINDVMLRTMQKAKYTTTNIGHFGLASRCYCHFTSPIRRYPDLVVHRIVKTAVSGKMTEKAILAYQMMAEDTATQSSKQERNADEAERKADDVLKCKYASKHIGQTFDAIISGVTERGFFAELPNTVEGFVSITKLNGYVTYNAQKFCLSNGSIKYSLGDSVKIVIQSVNNSAFKIDFDLADATQEQ